MSTVFRNSEKRLSHLLEKIRSKSSNSSSSSSKKLKKLQVKYERYDDASDSYKIVKQKEGGGPRFVDLEVMAPVSFKEIKRKIISLYFDENSSCNHFKEDHIDCIIDLVSVSGQHLSDNEDFWEYIQKKGLVISKTILILRSKLIIDDKEDSLPPLDSKRKRKTCHLCNNIYEGQECFCSIDNTDPAHSLDMLHASNNFEDWLSSYSDGLIPDESQVQTASRCNICHCTMQGLNCLRCQQNQEFTECLTNDQLVSANQHQQHENERTGTVQPSNNQIGVEDLRQRRIHHFSTSPSDFTENGKALIIKIHRIKIKEDFIKGFILNKVCLEDSIRFEIIDPRGETEKGIGSGVTREVYSSFWEDAKNCYLVGETERVPVVRHDLFKEEWWAIGMILLKGFKDANYFPTLLSKAFVHYCLYDKVSDEQLNSSFLNFLSPDEAETIGKVLNSASDDDEIFSSDELFEILDQFKCRSRITRTNACTIISEIARQELVQKPYLMTSCWKDSFHVLGTFSEFSSIKAVDHFYDAVKPTGKKVVGLLISSPQNDSERDALSYLKRFIRGLDIINLKKFLKFLTGSDLLIVGSINVSFTKPESEFSRRPIARTCSPILELPSTYSNFCELREELMNIINQSTWEMNIV